MSEALYQDAIMALVRRAREIGRLDPADASARVDNPLCGDRVTIDFRLRGGRITAVGHKTQGCALCKAAAAVIADNAVGMDQVELHAVQRAVAAFLTTAEAPEVPWPQLGAFAPVKDFKARHDCVLLPFAAALKALDPG